MGLQSGLSLSDAKEMTTGAWMDVIMTAYNLQQEQEDTREATQADFDRFTA